MASSGQGPGPKGNGSTGKAGEGQSLQDENAFRNELIALLYLLPDDLIAFARAFVEGGCSDGTAAAREAGFSRTNAKGHAFRLKKNKNLQRLIHLLDMGYDRGPAPTIPSPLDRYDVTRFVDDITVRETVDHIGAILRGNPFDFFTTRDDGRISVRALKHVSADSLRAVKKVRLYKDGSIQVDMHDKNPILQGLARRYGIFSPPANAGQSGDGAEPEVLPPVVEGLEEVPDSLEALYKLEGGVTFRETVREMMFSGQPARELRSNGTTDPED